MKDLATMSHIINIKTKEIKNSIQHPLDREGAVMASKKRISIDQPASEVKQDPLR